MPLPPKDTATAPPAEPADTCITCPAYHQPKVGGTTIAALAGIDLRGLCQFFPAPVKKSADDWCAQHPQRRPA